MLRARGLKDRGSTFVCAFCRHQLPSRTDSLRRGHDPTSQFASSTIVAANAGRLFSPCGARQLSTTSAPRNQGDSGNGNDSGSSTPGGFPRSFPGPRPGGFGGFGVSKTSDKGSTVSGNGLLPHELAARQTTPEQAPANPTRSSSSNGNKASNQRDKRSNDGKVKSNPVLADIFNKARTPRPPPTPQAWTKDPRTSKSTKASKPSILDASNASKPTKAPAKWGSFSNRKATTTDLPREGQPYNSKSAFDTAFRERRTDSSSQKPEGDFWDQLENRTGKPRRAAPEGSPAAEEKTLEAEPEQSESQRENRYSSSRMEKEEFLDRGGSKSKRRQKFGKGSGRREDASWDDVADERWERAQRRKTDKQLRQEALAAMQEQAPQTIFLPEYINISNLAQALKQPQAGFLRDLEEMGFENITNDTIMTGETAALIAAEYNFEPTVDTGSQRDLRPRPPPEDVSVLPQRPPVVTIMGHVDHGKTTLLDWLRKSSVAAQEHGGITQHIGAFVVKMSSGKAITFLDTPGHAAFLSMRQRGANVTDIVVLVVAADDSVMPQTIEALKHARASKVPIIVAINKIDKPDARINEVKADLARHGVEIEDYGGDVQVVCVSGKTGQGMQDLEENILTLSEVLDVRAETDGMAEGWVLESSVKQDGRTATALVKRGTLRPGDFIVAGRTWARIRLLRNEAGTELAEAPPGTPVEILGWRELPSAGDQILQSPDENKAKIAVEYREEMAHREETSIQLAQQEQQQREKAAAEAAAEKAEQEGREATDENAAPSIIYQNFSVKADVVGSMEAVCGTIQEQGNNEVQAKILRSSVGQISEFDVDHAAASKSIIVNFNSSIQPHIKQLAEAAKVRILDHTVIYHVVDDVRSTLSDLLPELVSHRVAGEAQVLQIFPINIKKKVMKNIAGCRIRNGAVRKSSRVRVVRQGKTIFEGKVDTLKHVKKDIMEAGKGSECGIGLDGFEEFELDDEIQVIEEVKEKRTL